MFLARGLAKRHSPAPLGSIWRRAVDDCRVLRAGSMPSVVLRTRCASAVCLRKEFRRGSVYRSCLSSPAPHQLAARPQDSAFSDGFPSALLDAHLSFPDQPTSHIRRDECRNPCGPALLAPRTHSASSRSSSHVANN